MAWAKKLYLCSTYPQAAGRGDVSQREGPRVAAHAHREADRPFRGREEAVLGRQLVVFETAAAQHGHFEVLQRNVGEADVDVRARVEGEEGVDVAARNRLGESVRDQELEDVLSVHLGRGEIDDDASFRGTDGLDGRRLLRPCGKRGEKEEKR